MLVRKRFEKNVIELVDVGVPNLCWHFKDWILKVNDEVCGKMNGLSEGDIWWWNQEVKEAVSREKDAHKAMFLNSTD